MARTTVHATPRSSSRGRSGPAARGRGRAGRPKLIQARPGGKVMVSLKATDESGVRSVLVRFEGPANRSLTGGTNQVDPQTGLFHCPVLIPENAPSGTYSLADVTLQDNQGNVSFPLKDDPVELSFEVVGGSSDIKPPVLADIFISEVQSPEEGL